MIIRDAGSEWLVITQPDHAALAGRLMAAWQADGLPDRPTREAVLFATTHHDIGWHEEDADPRVDPVARRPYDFMNLPAEGRQAIWPRAVSALSLRSTYAAALVAQHALTIYRRYAADPTWHRFFAEMEASRDEWYAADRRPDGSSGGPLDPTGADRLLFLRDYAIVRIGDLLSLIFCNAWTEPEERDGYRLWLEGGRLQVAPDPFAGATIAFEVPTRRVRAGDYPSDLHWREAIAAAPVERLEGSMSGSGLP